MKQLHDLHFAQASSRGICLRIVTDEPGNPLSGNKGLKLRPWLAQASRQSAGGLLGVGGAWSNFLHSLALATHQAGVPSVGIVRTHHAAENKALQPFNPMLADAEAHGMQLRYVTPQEYRHRASEEWRAYWESEFPGYLAVPEGGSCLEASLCCQELLPRKTDEVLPTTHWMVSVGTGATASGIAGALEGEERLLALSATRDPDVESQLRAWAQAIYDANNPAVSADEFQRRIRYVIACPPAFGSLDPVLIELVNQCYEQSAVLLDPVYTVKALNKALQLVEQNEFPEASVLTLLHTGGLQGWRGFQQQYRSSLSEAVRQAIDSLTFTHSLAH